ncbi:YidH family protein [Mycolicibacterium wolinskyi]|uniref:YidH family protein n=1 Tax=Mycolicibacterium wolinskyi TaxID=59750 RepID=UPI0039177E0B
MVRRRFPRWVYGRGEEPDPRFTLANERTFLAWIRTGLALVAAGVALEAIALPLNVHLKQAASITLLIMGISLPLSSWWHWGRTERALRRDEPLPPSSIVSGLLVGGLLVVGVALTYATIVS